MNVLLRAVMLKEAEAMDAFIAQSAFTLTHLRQGYFIEIYTQKIPTCVPKVPQMAPSRRKSSSIAANYRWAFV